MDNFDQLVWLNPVRTDYWQYTPSIKLIQQLLGPQRMFPMTLAGLEQAVAALSK